MAALIGALRATLSADTANFEAGMRRAQGAAATAHTGIARSMGLIKGSLAGLAAGLSVGLFANLIKNSLEFAGSLGETAQQLGVTSRELQVFRYAAGQSGVSAEGMEKALAKMSISMSKAISGGKEAQKAFGALGVEMDDLQRGDRTQIFAKIADQMVKQGGAAKNSAAGMVVFGRGVMQLAPVLDQGAKGISEYAAAAEKLGIILSEEQIQKADETADKLTALKTVLSTNIAGVVADNAGAIMALANAVAYLVGKVSDGIDGLRALHHEFGALGNLLGGDVAGYTSEMNRSQAIRERAIAYGVGSVTMTLPAAKPVVKGQGGTPPEFLSKGGGAKKAAADHSAEEGLRAEYQFQQDVRRANMDILRAKQSLATDYVEQTSLAIDMLDAERADYEAELQYQTELFKLTKGKQGMSEAQAAQLRAAYGIADGLKREKVLHDEQVHRAEDVQNLTDEDFARRKEVLEAQAAIATTAAERRQIELELLNLAYAQKRQALQAILDGDKDEQEKEQARRDLINLNATYGAERQGVLQQTRGPFEDWAASIPQSAEEINEALQTIQVQGFEGLSQAISDVITGASTLEDAFSSMARSIISDIIEMTIKMLIFRAVSSIFGAAFGGSGLGQSAYPVVNGVDPLAPMAGGGSILVGGRGGTDRNILSLNGLPVARVSQGERIDVSNGGQGGDAGQPTRVVVELNDPMLQAKIVEGAGQVVVASTPHIVRAARSNTISTLQRPKLPG